MEICSRFTGMERKDGAFLLHTDIKVCFMTDEIVRVRASFDHKLAEESYVLMTTAWEDRIKPLPDAALYRSAPIHHTPDSYTKRELVGAGPLHLAYARPFGRLKAPLGLSLLHFAAQTRPTLFLLCTKSCIVWRKIGVWRIFYWKSIKRKSLKLLGTSRSFRLCHLKIGNLLFNRLHRGDRSRSTHERLYIPL